MKFEFRCIECGMKVKYRLSFEIDIDKIEIYVSLCNNCIKNSAKIDIEKGLDPLCLNIKNSLLQKYKTWENIPILELYHSHLINKKIKHCLLAEEVFKLGDFKNYKNNKWHSTNINNFKDYLLKIPNFGKKSFICIKSILDLFNIRID